MASIVVLDDDELMLKMIEASLIAEGWNVIALSQSKKLVEHLKNTDISLLITDILMPDRDGLEVIRTIKAMHKGCKILAISGGGGMAAKDLLTMATCLGVEDTLSKPFSVEVLVEKVKALLCL